MGCQWSSLGAPFLWCTSNSVSGLGRAITAGIAGPKANLPRPVAKLFRLRQTGKGKEDFPLPCAPTTGRGKVWRGPAEFHIAFTCVFRRMWGKRPERPLENLVCPMGGDATSKIHSPVKKVMSPLEAYHRYVVADAACTSSDNIIGGPEIETSDNVNRAPQC